MTDDESLDGLTPREYFAGLALQGMCVNAPPTMLEQDASRFARCAVNMADALLAELSKAEGGDPERPERLRPTDGKPHPWK